MRSAEGTAGLAVRDRHLPAMDDQVLTYLLSERARMGTRLAMLRSGRSWTSEMHNGEQVDTTAQTLSTLEDKLEEIARLLCKAGVASE